ncbi:MAG: glycosyltransferase family 4 protein, partial [Halothece sp. Uz-M2-17]|nr:glycosyltransferase family 4 protein [Halothece sp. Uz-M2-17]
MSKISIITQFYPPDHAATGQLVEELAQQLSYQKIEIKIITGQPAYGETKPTIASPREKQELITVRRSLTSRIFPKWLRGRIINGLLFCFYSALRLLKPDYRGDVLLLTTEPPYLLLVGYLGKVFLNIPYVCLLYDLYPDVAINLNVLSDQHWLSSFWNWLNLKIWHQAKGIIVLSTTMKERIVSKDPTLADKVTVIHSWCDPDYITPKPKTDNDFAIQHELVKPFTILYSGNMGRCHDMETIMGTAWELREESMQFVFIGGGAKYDDCYNRLIQEWGLKNCLFLPFQPKKNLPNSLT